MKVKVCGITDLHQLKMLQQVGVDYAGLIFYEHSKRFAGEKLMNQKSEIRNLEIKKVGVFVNENLQAVQNTIAEYGLHAVQLHGDETPDFCKVLKGKTKVVKVFRVNGTEHVDELVLGFQDASDYFLFDTSLDKGDEQSTYGGTGRHFNWQIIQQAEVGKPFFLSGGIGPDDVQKIKSFHHPHLFAVDINSRFELEPGVKDLNKVGQFINEIKDTGCKDNIQAGTSHLK